MVKRKVSREDVVKRHMKRSPGARAMDDSLHAEKTYKMGDTSGMREWMKSPNRVDIIGLDTVDILPPKGWLKPKTTQKKKAVKTKPKPKPATTKAKPKTVKAKPKTTKAKPKKKESKKSTSKPAPKRMSYNYVKEYAPATKKKMDSLLDATLENFTQDEIAPIIKNVSFRHGVRRGARDAAGYFMVFSDGSSEIGLHSSVAKNRPSAVHTLTHELVHALRRNGEGRKGHSIKDRSRDSEEAQTVAETITRHRRADLESKPMYGHPSYYAMLGETEYDANRKADKRTMSGTKQHLIGAAAIKSVEENYPKTHIAKMAREHKGHGIKGTNENIDQHFLVQDKKTKRIDDLHIYSPKAKMSPRAAAEFAEMFDGIKGDDRVWAFDDGKKKLVIK